MTTDHDGTHFEDGTVLRALVEQTVARLNPVGLCVILPGDTAIVVKGHFTDSVHGNYCKFAYDIQLIRHGVVGYCVPARGLASLWEIIADGD